MSIRPVLCSLLLLLLLPPLSARAEAIDMEARQAIITDFQTGTVLVEKNADELMEPVSMTKLMTVYLLFEALHEGRAKLTDMLPISERAWRMGGSQTFLEVGGRISIEDLLRGIIVQSGNDACVVIAEGLAGSEEAFAEQMTKKAREIGMTSSVFKNSHGLPEEGHVSTARDLATLAHHLIADFPEYYHYFSEREFTYGGITQHNRNPLLDDVPGADGLKTGHAKEPGYGLTASVEREGRRIIMVIHGLPSMRERREEARRLVEWAFREFENYTLAKAGDPIEEAPVWLGARDTVPLVVGKDLVVTLPRGAGQQITVTATYDAPVPAPVEAGQQVGKLSITFPGGGSAEMPLLAGTAVEPMGIPGRIIQAIKHLVLASN